MSSVTNCLECGAQLLGDSPVRFCAKCLLALASGDAPPAPVDPAEPMASRAIQRFGDYELLEQIGRGGMGVVYRALDRRLNRLVALKMIHGVDRTSPISLARFHIEAQTSAKLDHPNIVSTYEVGEWEGTPFF